MKNLFLMLLGVSIFSCQPKSEVKDDNSEGSKPNIIFIMSDDHARNAISAYTDKLIQTPNIDRISNEGLLIRNGFVTNSICAPARAAVLTGKYSHLNGLRDNRDTFDGSQLTFPKILQDSGYTTHIVGKWHLKSEPTGFDNWNILIDQGEYYNPRFVTDGDTIRVMGYTSDVITERALENLNSRDKSKPFMMMIHHKAPHRNWMPKIEHAKLFEEDLPIPETLYDNWEGRQALAEQDQSINRMWLSHDLKIDKKFYDIDTATGGGPATGTPPENWFEGYKKYMTEAQITEWTNYYDSIGAAYQKANLKGKEELAWRYQRYIKDYLACIYSVDENVGRILDYLDENGLAENTIIVYTSDQGFYLGEHGMYDKRFMYEESFSTPMLVRYPKAIKPGSETDDLIVNIDWGPTFLDFAGAKVPSEMQGNSLRQIFAGNSSGWRNSVYYHYYEYPHGWHRVKKHYGIRTDRYKLIHFYDDIDTWELFDLQNDPNEMNNLIDHPEYLDIVSDMKKQLLEKQIELDEKEEIVQLTKAAL